MLTTPRIVALALLTAVLVACGEDLPPPEPVFESIRTALLAKDYGAVYDLMAASEHRRMAYEATKLREDVARMNTDPALAERLTGLAEIMGLTAGEMAALSDRELFIRGTTSRPPPMLASWTDAEFVGDPWVDGKRCRQRMLLPGNRKGEMRLVLEDNAWRLVLR